MKPAFSSVACWDWTLDALAARGESWGYQGVELRSFGTGSFQFAADPALTSADKVRSMFDRAGLELMCVSTGIRYDDPVSPPIVGHVVGDNERSLRETKSAIDLAARLECPFVRVFAFEVMGHEKRERALARIVERLRMALDACRNRGVRLLLENGGSFSTATDLAEIMDRCDHPLLGAAYSVAAANAAGERPSSGINVLGERLCSVKLKDYKNGAPCMLGEGTVPNREAMSALKEIAFDGWLVYEHPRAWLSHDSGDPEEKLAHAAKTLYSWIGHAPRAARAHAMSR
jgi:sugar phosphate isomerase/epimerase